MSGDVRERHARPMTLLARMTWSREARAAADHLAPRRGRRARIRPRRMLLLAFDRSAHPSDRPVCHEHRSSRRLGAALRSARGLPRSRAARCAARRDVDRGTGRGLPGAVGRGPPTGGGAGGGERPRGHRRRRAERDLGRGQFARRHRVARRSGAARPRTQLHGVPRGGGIPLDPGSRSTTFVPGHASRSRPRCAMSASATATMSS